MRGRVGNKTLSNSQQSRKSATDINVKEKLVSAPRPPIAVIRPKTFDTLGFMSVQIVKCGRPLI